MGEAPPADPADTRPHWKAVLHRFAHSRWTKLATALFLLGTALVEITEGLFLDLHETVDPAHGLLVLGGVLLMQSMAEILEAVEFLDEAENDES